MSSYLSERPFGLVVPEFYTPDRVPEGWVKEFQREQREHARRMRYFLLNQNWEGVANAGSQATAHTTVNTHTTIQNAGPAPTFSLPGGVIPGTLLRVNAGGVFGTKATPAGNLTVQVMYGGTGGTSLYTTGAVSVGAGRATAVWRIEVYVRFLTTGSAGTATTYGWQQGVSTTANKGVPVQALTKTVSVNTITSHAITLAVTWSTSSATNKFATYFYVVEQLN